MDRYTIDVTALVKASTTVVLDATSESDALNKAHRRLADDAATYTIGDAEVRVPATDLMDVANAEVAAVRPSQDAQSAETVYRCDFEVTFPGGLNNTPDPDGYGADYVAQILDGYTRKSDPASPLAGWRYARNLRDEALLPAQERGPSSTYHAHLQFFVHAHSPADALVRITKLLRVDMEADDGWNPFEMASPREVPWPASAIEIDALNTPENDNPAPAPRRRARP